MAAVRCRAVRRHQGWCHVDGRLPAECCAMHWSVTLCIAVDTCEGRTLFTPPRLLAWVVGQERLDDGTASPVGSHKHRVSHALSVYR